MNRLPVRSLLRARSAVASARHLMTKEEESHFVDFESPEDAAAYAAARPYHEIPGPRPLPLIGNVWRYMPIIGEYSFERLHKTYQKMYHQYGPLIRERVLGKRELLHCFDTKDMETVYMHRIEWPHRDTHQALKKYRLERPDKFKNTGVFLSNGEDWARLRRNFSPVVSREEAIKIHGGALEDITGEFVEKVESIVDEKNEVDLQPWLFKLAIESISAVTLDRRLGCLSDSNNITAEKLVKAAHDTHQCIFVTEVSPFYQYFKTKSYKKLEAAQDFVGDLVEQFIKTDAMGPNAMIRKLLKLQGVEYREVFSVALDMFLAGIDTTSYTMAFGLYNLAKNPRVQNKLREQLMERLPRKDTPLSDIIPEFEYLNNVMNESLRLNPVAFGNGRILTCNLVLSGYQVPKGTQVILQHQAASLNPKYFERPAEFLPERYTSKEFASNESNFFASAPFGFGGRPCMGKRLAEREMLLLFGKMVRSYHISYHYEDIDCFNRLVNVPDKPLRLRFDPVQE